MSSGLDGPVEPIGVGAVGLAPDEDTGLLPDLPQRQEFRVVAFSDEGLDSVVSARLEATYYSDYNRMLQDGAVELVLVGGPVELRRDLAVRALNAGRHVVLLPPFGQSASDAERVLKTALRHGLVATADMGSRDDPDFRALQTALAEERAGPVRGLFCFCTAADPAPDAEESDLLEATGLHVLDQVNMVLGQDVASISAHVERRLPDGPAHSFMLYLPLRGNGWAVCQSGRPAVTGLPRWVVYTSGTAFTVTEGHALASTGVAQRIYTAPEQPEGFWANLYAAVRHQADLKCHPVDVVRAMKLHEAALLSAATGEPSVV